MKIVYFNYMADLYGYSIGSTIKAKKLLSALEQHGHTVKFYWLVKQTHQDVRSSSEKKSSYLYSLLRNLFFTPKNVLQNVTQFVREIKILKTEKADLLIARLDAFRISALWAARLYQLPLIVEADGATSYEYLTFNNGRHLWPSVLLWCERLMLSKAQGIFTQSNEAKSYFVEKHGINPQKISVITNGADIVDFNDKSNTEKLRQELGIAANTKIIGFIGSMHHWHGVADVPQLIENVLGKFPHAIFLFVGSGGALEEDLRRSFSDALANRIKFTGHVPNEQAPDYVRLFDAAIAPYPKIELFYFSPMKLYEYMAAGKAIVAARIGQIKEVIEDGENGILYEPGDIAELQAKLIALLKDEPRQKVLGNRALKSFLSGYTWRHKAQQLDEYMQQCVQPN